MGESPLVVVGTPGSGTRVFARLAEASGRDMGAYQSEANDALALFRFADKWCPRVYSAWKSGTTLDHSEFESDLSPRIEAHLSETKPGAPWGWKQPRSLYMLPALATVYPDLRVIHVLRDGRDVAFSSEPNVKLAGKYVMPAMAVDRPAPVKAAIVWDEPNRLAAEFGERQLGDRYLRLRLEDLCATPEETADGLAHFAEGTRIGPDRIHSIVQSPASLGRWRGEDPELVASIASAASEGLRRFEYA